MSVCQPQYFICEKTYSLYWQTKEYPVQISFLKADHSLHLYQKYSMRRILMITMVLLSITATAQKVNWAKLAALQPDKILLKGNRQPTKVLLLGTFHFGYPNLDGHKTDSSKFIDVKSPQRQKEIEELAEVIRRFRPTRIYVESNDQSWIDSLYGAYMADRYKLGRNEIFQLGFRIARQMRHTKLYAVDTWPFSSQYFSRFPLIDSLWNDNSPVDSLRDQYWDARYKAFYTAGDSVELGLTMLENFLLMAMPEVLQRMHGHYLVSGFAKETNAGADILSLWWYNRNLRIYNNIMRTKPTAQDRIVVLFGNGHIPILKHCFHASPEFEVVELKTLLKK
jgi:Family of unknown function (DUF5694)